MATWTPGVCELYSVGVRTEPCDTPACIYWGVDILPSTVTVNFLLQKNELISLIMLTEN